MSLVRAHTGQRPLQSLHLHLDETHTIAMLLRQQDQVLEHHQNRAETVRQASVLLVGVRVQMPKAQASRIDQTDIRLLALLEVVMMGDELEMQGINSRRKMTGFEKRAMGG